MRHSLITALSMVTIGTIIGSAPSQAASLSDYVDAALANNYGLQSTTQSLESQKYQSDITSGALRPSLTFSASHGYSRNVTFNDGVSDSVDESQQQNLALNLSQVLFDRTVFLDQKSARIDLSRTALEVENDRGTTINETVNAYFGYLQSLAQLRTTRLEQDSSRVRLKQIRRSFELGNVAKTDVLEAEASLEAVRGQIIAQENAVRIAQRNLQEITLLPNRPAFDIQANAVVAGIPEDQVTAYRTYLPDYNYDVLIAAKDVESAQTDVHSRKAAFWPTLSLNASHSYSHSDAPGANAPPASGWSQAQSVTVNLDLPLYIGGTRIYGLRRGESELHIARINYDDTRNRITADLDEALYNINSNAQSIEILRKAVTSSQQSYNSLKRAYELGTRSLTDLLGAEGDLYNAIRDYYNARYDYIINYTNLHQINGSLTPEIVAALTAEMRPFNPTDPLEIPHAAE